MKLIVYNLRTFDEKEFFDKWCNEYGYEYIGVPDMPNYDNAKLAKGADAINIITTPMKKDMLDIFHEMGVKYITTRAIGVDHIDVAYAHKLGMKVSNVCYSPDSVANYAIMMMLVGCRKYTQILKRANMQDYSLKGCMGRELSECTVGVIGTGKIGLTVIRHLSSFGCHILAHSRHQNIEVQKVADYVPMDELLKKSDIIKFPAVPLRATASSADK